MRYKATHRTSELMRALLKLAAEIEDDLHLVSEAARDEWKDFRSSWPSDDELRQGLMRVSDAELEWTTAKVLRLRDIIRASAQQFAGGRVGVMAVGQAAA